MKTGNRLLISVLALYFIAGFVCGVITYQTYIKSGNADTKYGFHYYSGLITIRGRQIYTNENYPFQIYQEVTLHEWGHELYQHLTAQEWKTWVTITRNETCSTDYSCTFKKNSYTYLDEDFAESVMQYYLNKPMQQDKKNYLFSIITSSGKIK